MKNLNIVAIGGGTGLSMILGGLKEWTENLTAIVTVADDGGSSGLLRQDLNILPPGDIRDCMLALADTELTMELLFNYRFERGTLKGQNFGNLLIAAMNKIYGDFSTAIKETSKVLNITGTVLPVTLDNMDLVAELKNGTIVKGESQIPKRALAEGTSIKKMSLEADNAVLLADCLDAIHNSEVIVLGPGSLYTSIIPNLLVRGLASAIKESQAKTIYICNAVTEHGETDDYSVSDHVEAILDHSEEGIIDYVLVNKSNVPTTVQKTYDEEKADLIFMTNEDYEWFEDQNIQCIQGDFITTENGRIRHIPDKLSEAIIDISSS